MDDLNAIYTPEELADKTIQAYYRVLALEMTMTNMMGSMLIFLSKLEAPITPEQAKVASVALRQQIAELRQSNLLCLLSEDPKVSPLLKKKLSDELGLP